MVLIGFWWQPNSLVRAHFILDGTHMVQLVQIQLWKASDYFSWRIIEFGRHPIGSVRADSTLYGTQLVQLGPI